MEKYSINNMGNYTYRKKDKKTILPVIVG